MGIYESLGVNTVINADARWTGLGASLMPEPVQQAMAEAASGFVSIAELQKAAGRRIAELTNNEAAYITVNATAGIMLSVLACITRSDPLRIARYADLAEFPREVVIHAAHRIPFDPAITLGQGEMVQIGNAYRTTPEELRAAITDATAAVFYVAGSHVSGALSLETTVDIAHESGVPVIVDAAAQLPPRSNLWHYSKDLGADLVIFSGEKDLSGPQASGRIVGSEEYISACTAVGPPSPHLPRVLKTGKEEIAGLVRAVELYMSRDEDAFMEGLHRTVDGWIERIGHHEGVTAELLLPNLDGQPTPRAKVTVDPDSAGLTGAEVRTQLAQGNPPIMAGAIDTDSFYLTPETLKPGEETTVADRVESVLKSANN